MVGLQRLVSPSLPVETVANCLQILGVCMYTKLTIYRSNAPKVKVVDIIAMVMMVAILSRACACFIAPAAPEAGAPEVCKTVRRVEHEQTLYLLRTSY